MSKDIRTSTRSERIYRGLLKAYPKKFRAEYGAHMAQVFQDLRRETSERDGRTALMGLWIRTLLDLATSAVRERRRSNMDASAARDPWLAAFLSFLWVGLGQLYTGRKAVGSALVVSGAVWLLVFFGGAADAGGQSAYVFLTIACLAVQLWSIWDAYAAAKRAGQAIKVD